MIRVANIFCRVSAKTAWGDLGRLGREGWWELEQRAPPVGRGNDAAVRPDQMHELGERNGWFLRRAAAAGRTQPEHRRLLASVGVEAVD